MVYNQSKTIWCEYLRFICSWCIKCLCEWTCDDIPINRCLHCFVRWICSQSAVKNEIIFACYFEYIVQCTNTIAPITDSNRSGFSFFFHIERFIHNENQYPSYSPTDFPIWFLNFFNYLPKHLEFQHHKPYFLLYFSNTYIESVVQIMECVFLADRFGVNKQQTATAIVFFPSEKYKGFFSIENKWFEIKMKLINDFMAFLWK